MTVCVCVCVSGTDVQGREGGCASFDGRAAAGASRASTLRDGVSTAAPPPTGSLTCGGGYSQRCRPPSIYRCSADRPGESAAGPATGGSESAADTARSGQRVEPGGQPWRCLIKQRAY